MAHVGTRRESAMLAFFETISRFLVKLDIQPDRFSLELVVFNTH